MSDTKDQDGKTELQRNAEKALEMKRSAEPIAHIPEHRTSHEGGVQGSQVDPTDIALSSEPANASQLKRSHNARSGDAS